MNRKRLRITLLYLGSAIIAYALIGFLALPALVKRQLIQYVEHDLGHRLSIGTVRMNPFSLTAEVTDLSLMEPSGASLVGFKRLFANLQAISLLRRAWTFAELTVDSPSLTLELRSGERTNYSALLGGLPTSPDRTTSAPPPIIIERIAVHAGELSIADATAGDAARLKLQPIDFALTELSTLPSQRGSLRLSARSGQAERITWEGTITLAPVASAGRLTLAGWKVATLARLLGNRVAIHRAEGEIHCSFDYRAQYAEGVPSLAVSNARIAVDDLLLATGSAGDPAVRAKHVALDGTFDLARRRLDVERIALTDASTLIEIDTDGRSNIEGLVPRANEPTSSDSASAPTGSAAAWSARLGQLSADGVRFRLIDRRPGRVDEVSFGEGRLVLSAGLRRDAANFETTVEDVAFSAANGVMNHGGDKLALGRTDLRIPRARLLMSEAATDASLSDFSLGMERLSMAGVDARWSIDESALQAESVTLLAPADASPPAVTLTRLRVESTGLAGGLSANKDLASLAKLAVAADSVELVLADALGAEARGIQASGTGLNVRDPYSGKELARLATAQASGGSLSSRNRRASLERISFSDGHVTVLRDGDAQFNWNTLAKAFGAGAVPAERSEPVAAPTPPWDLLARSIELNGFAGTFSDRSSHSPFTLSLEAVSAKAINAGTRTGKPVAVEISGRVKEGGKLTAAGSIDPATLATDVTLKLTELSVLPWREWLAHYARLKLVSALLSVDGRLRHGLAKEAGAKFVFEGTVGLDKVLVEETDPAQPFLSLGALRASQMRLALEPNGLDVPDLRVTQLATKLLIAEDQSVNLVKVLRRPLAGTAPAPVKSEDAKVQDRGPASEFPVSVGRLRLDDAEVEFADLSLRPRFRARMHELKGVVTGLSSSEQARAQLELDARVDEFGSARIRGAITPRVPRRFTEVDMRFQNINMNALTPYSSRFAGYRITSGRLSVDLQYRVRNNALKGDHKIVIDQLELGERAEASQSGLNLPLELAVALLKDSNGRIDVDLPVSGSLDDPQVSIGALVWKAIGNLLTGIVTAPFRAIAGMLGAPDADTLGAIEFEAGTAALRPPEQQKLKTLAEALRQRPKLRLEIFPTYSPSADAAALKSLALRRAVVARTGVKLAPQESPGPLDFGNARAQQAIEALYVERYGSPAARELRARSKPTDPNQPVGASEAPSAPTQPMQATRTAQAMFEQLVDGSTIGSAELGALGTRRGEAIAAELKRAGHAASDRLTTAAPRPVDAQTGPIVSSLELGVLK